MAAKKEIDLSEFRKIRKAGCQFANLKLDPDHVEVLQTVMKDDEYSAAGIHEWMRKRGYQIGLGSLKSHRNGTCICP
jgi:Fe2+ or Zn2+ uptake regulation protein